MATVTTEYSAARKQSYPAIPTVHEHTPTPNMVLKGKAATKECPKCASTYIKVKTRHITEPQACVGEL